MSTDRRRSSKLKYLWIALPCFLICVPVILLIVFAMGQHSGREFSPDDFSRRTFQYNQFPGLNWVLFKKTYVDITPNLELDLVADKRIKPVINNPKTWHLIWDSGDSTGLASNECDARFLTDYLDMVDEEGLDYWTQWNDKYPISANDFWPMIAKLARDEMYLKIPDVMQFAIQVESDKPKEFKPSIDRVVAKAYREMGQLDVETGQLDRARHRLDQSILIHPTREAYLIRSECLEKMGFLKESSQDQDLANSFEENASVEMPEKDVE